MQECDGRLNASMAAEMMAAARGEKRVAKALILRTKSHGASLHMLACVTAWAQDATRANRGAGRECKV